MKRVWLAVLLVGLVGCGVGGLPGIVAGAYSGTLSVSTTGIIDGAPYAMPPAQQSWTVIFNEFGMPVRGGQPLAVGSSMTTTIGGTKLTETLTAIDQAGDTIAFEADAVAVIDPADGTGSIRMTGVTYAVYQKLSESQVELTIYATLGVGADLISVEKHGVLTK